MSVNHYIRGVKLPIRDKSRYHLRCFMTISSIHIKYPDSGVQKSIHTRLVWRNISLALYEASLLLVKNKDGEDENGR